MAQKTVKDRGLTPEEIERETKKLASKLAFCARAPVTIQLVGGKHIAYTYNAEDSKKQHQIPIVMNPDKLKGVRQKEQAIKIWWGIGYHELLHHLHPAAAQYKLAYKEGFGQLYNLIDDEQNERRGRAMDPTWGACFQAVCAYYFTRKNLEKDGLWLGIVDGGKEGKKPRGRAASKVYTRRWNQFAFHFRRHVPDPADPIVAEALALIPENFKDLSKDELVELTRLIHDKFLEGVEMPVAPPKPGTGQAGNGVDSQSENDQDDDEADESEDEEEEPKEDENKEEDEKIEKPEEDEKKEEEDEPPVDPTWSLHNLLRSKWLYVPFIVFITGWSALLMHGKVSMWMQIAVYMFIGVCVSTAFLFVRRAYIKKMIADFKAKVKAARAGGGSGTSGSSTKEKLKEWHKKPAFVGCLAGLCAGGAAFALWKVSHHVSQGATLLIAASMLLLSLGIGAAYLMKRAKDKKEEDQGLSKPVWALIILVGTASLGMTVFGMWDLGFRAIFFLPVVLVLMVALMFLWFKLADLGERENALKRLKRSLKERWHSFWDAVKAALSRFFKWLGRYLGRVCHWIALGWQWVWSKVVLAYKFIAKWSQRLWWFCQPTLMILWRNPVTRLFILALPPAVLLVLLHAVMATAGKTSIWLMILLLLLLLALAILGFIFRKKLKNFVVNELFMEMPTLMDVALQGGLDMETEWFVQVDDIGRVEPNQEVLDQLQPQIYALAQQVRPFLKQCGRLSVDREDQPEGYDLTDEAELALVGETSIFVDDDVVPRTSLHLEVALDCSTSMASPTQSLKPGEKFLLGRLFQLAVEQACLNLPGVSAHFWGFTHNQIYDCGVPGEGRSSGLVCSGGNNDAAMLWHMGQSAAASGKDVKILMMLSDGQPSACSWLSLKNLVVQFEQEGMIPWNFALDVIEIPAFERFFTDLVGQTMEEAIVTMGATLASIAQECI